MTGDMHGSPLFRGEFTNVETSLACKLSFEFSAIIILSSSEFVRSMFNHLCSASLFKITGILWWIELIVFLELVVKILQEFIDSLPFDFQVCQIPAKAKGFLSNVWMNIGFFTTPLCGHSKNPSDNTKHLLYINESLKLGLDAMVSDRAFIIIEQIDSFVAQGGISPHFINLALD